MGECDGGSCLLLWIISDSIQNVLFVEPQIPLLIKGLESFPWLTVDDKLAWIFLVDHSTLRLMVT